MYKRQELPDPRGAGIEADKITAYEQADMRRRQEEKMRTLEDFSAMADGGRQEVVTEPLIELSPDTDVYKRQRIGTLLPWRRI